MIDGPEVDELGVRRRSREEAGLDSVEARAMQTQRLAYAARDFVMCGLPFKRPKYGATYKRKNGEFALEIRGSEEFGLPYGQDRLIPIWLATAFFACGRPADGVIRFRCMKDILRAFDLNTDGGFTLARLIERIQRVYYATFFVTRTGPNKDGGIERMQASYRLMRSVTMNFYKDAPHAANQYTLWQDSIVLDPAFAQELRDGGRVPIDLESVKYLKDCTPALDLYVWQAWRSYRLERDRKGPTSIPIFGESGLMAQLGSEATSPKKIRAMLRDWQAQVRRVWQGCPNFLDRDCDRLLLFPGNAIATHQKVPELPGVSIAPPPLRRTADGEGHQLILVREDEPADELAPA